jgi:hypothetical protein
VTRIATAAYSELISPKERPKMKRAASNNGCCGLWSCRATPKFKPTDVIFGQATLSTSTVVPVAPCRASLRLSPLILGPPHVQSEIGVIIMHLPPARLPSIEASHCRFFFPFSNHSCCRYRTALTMLFYTSNIDTRHNLRVWLFHAACYGCHVLL